MLPAVAVDRRGSHVLRVSSRRRPWLCMTCIRVRSCLVPLIVWRHRVRRRLQLRIAYTSKRQANVPVTEQVSQSV